MLNIGQVLKGKLGFYRLTSELQDNVWPAAYVPYPDSLALSNKRTLTQSHQQSIDYSKSHRQALGAFPYRQRERRASSLSVQNTASSPASGRGRLREMAGYCSRHLDEDLLARSSRRNLTRGELRWVSRGVLEALDVLDGDGFVHTGKHKDHRYGRVS